MTDANLPESTSPPPSEPPVPAPKKRRKWPWILLGIFVVLILLVLLAPTIASTSPVRSMVVSKINGSLNGKLDISDWSIGWTSGITVNGIKVDDDKGRRIVEVSSVRLPISLLAAARGNYDLGNVVIEKPTLLNLEVYQDGTTNLDKLVKETPKEAKPPTSRLANGTSKLPDVKGKITITEARGTIAFPDSSIKRPPIYIDPTNVVIEIPDINQPIKNTINLAFHVGSAPQATVTIAGDVSAIQNNVVDVDKLKADETIDLGGVDLAPFGPFASAPGSAVDLAGLAKGTLHLKVDTLKAASVDGQLSVADLAVGGAPLKGDTYKSKALNIPINVMVTPQGATDSLVKIDKLQIESDHVLVDVSGQATQSAMEHLAKSEAPGSDGALALAITGKDIPGLINLLRNTLRLQKDVQITEGKFAMHLNGDLSATDVKVKQDLDVQAAGTNAGKAITLDPLHLDSGVTVLPTGKGTPDLRDVALNLASAFASASGGGKSLDALDVQGKMDLAKLDAQLAQFVDLSGKSFAGAGTFNITSKGNLTQAGGQAVVEAKLTLDDVIVHGVAAKGDLNQPHTVVDASATLARGKSDADGFIAAIPGAKLTLQAGNANVPVIDLLADATNIKMGDSQNGPMGVEHFAVQKCTVDLPRAQQQFAAFMPAGFRATAGTFNAQISGSCVNRLMQFDEKAQVQHLTLQVVDQANVARSIVTDENEDIATAGTFQTTPDTLTSTIKLTELAASSSNKLFSIAKSAAQPLEITLHDNGKTTVVAGNGQLTVASDLKPLMDVVQSLSAAPAPAPGAAGELTSGNFAATVTLANNDKGGTIHLDGGIDNLSVTTHEQPISGEKVALKMDATTAADFSSMNVSSATVDSSFAKTTVTDAQIQLTGGVFDMLQRAKLLIAVPDIEKTMTVAQAFSPPPAKPTQAIVTGTNSTGAAAAPAKALDPLQIGGGAVVEVDLTREPAKHVMHINVPQLAASKMSMVRGKYKFAFKEPIACNLAADLMTESVASAASTQPSEQIKQIQITQLGGDLGGVATMSMPKPISVKNLSSSTPSADGQIALSGAIEPLMQLLSVIQEAAPMPYRGDYAVNQNIATQNNQIGLNGDVTINKLVVLQADGKPAFSEDKLVVADNLLADTSSQTATINDLSVDMTSSKAASLDVQGTLADWEVKRQFNNFTINLGYDLAKIWPIIKPMMSPAQQTQFADLKIAGQFQRTFKIGGSYPASADGKVLAFNQSIKSLTMSGALAVQMLDTNGADLTNFELPLWLENGQLITLYGDKPKAERAARPASFNGGTLDLSSIVVDLTGDVPRLSIGKNQKLVTHAAMNEILARALGKYANAIFANTEKAKGDLDVTIAYCDNVALGQQLQTDMAGKAKMLFSLTNMELINPVSQQIVQVVASQIQGVGELATALGFVGSANGDMSNAKTLKGAVENGSIILENGKITEDITMQLVDSGATTGAGGTPAAGGGRKHGSNNAVATPPAPAAAGTAVSMPLTVKGDMTLSNMSQNLAINVPARLVGNAIGIKSVQDFLTQAFPNGIPFRMTGTPDKFALNPLVGMKDAAKDYLVGHFLTGNGKNGGDSGLGGLLDSLGKKKK